MSRRKTSAMATAATSDTMRSGRKGNMQKLALLVVVP